MTITLNLNSFATKFYPCKQTISQLCRFNSSHSTKKITKKITVFKQIESKRATDGRKTPLCVLLGWGDSKQHQLRKYSEIYEKRGFNTITVSPLLLDALVFPDLKGKKISYKILETIANEFEGEIPIVFHQFSNGGLCLYYFMCEELVKKDGVYGQQMKVVGSIFDSCPVIPDADSIPRAQRVFTNELKNPILKTMLWYTIGAVLPFVVRMNPLVKVFINSLENSTISSPQMFLYSESDDLAPYKDIDAFIEYRKKRGVDVMAQRWRDTLHVRHFMSEPDKYVEMIDNFLKRLTF